VTVNLIGSALKRAFVLLVILLCLGRCSSSTGQETSCSAARNGPMTFVDHPIDGIAKHRFLCLDVEALPKKHPCVCRCMWICKNADGILAGFVALGFHSKLRPVCACARDVLIPVLAAASDGPDARSHARFDSACGNAWQFSSSAKPQERKSGAIPRERHTLTPYPGCFATLPQSTSHICGWSS
jgi:hypothetical protein